MPEQEQTQHPRHWHLDKRFTIGNLITSLVIIGSVFIWVYKLDQRISLVEQSVLFQKEIHERDNTQTRRVYEEIKLALRRIEDKLDGKADKQQ